jgi:hypothetical protein
MTATVCRRAIIGTTPELFADALRAHYDGDRIPAPVGWFARTGLLVCGK